MVLWLEEVERREAAARAEISELRSRMEELAGRLAEREAVLSRLEITQETMTEILSGDGAFGAFREACDLRAGPRRCVVSIRRHTHGVDHSSRAVSGSTRKSSGWVESLGGPLIAVPVSVLAEWGGCWESWGEESSILEDYDRACVSRAGPGSLMSAAVVPGLWSSRMSPPPAGTCPSAGSFCAGSSPTQSPSCWPLLTPCSPIPISSGTTSASGRRTGPSCSWTPPRRGPNSMRSTPTAAGRNRLSFRCPLPAGRWRVRAVHTTGEFPWAGVVQLLPERL